jgi:Protein of unknown function (DUF3563)
VIEIHGAALLPAQRLYQILVATMTYVQSGAPMSAIRRYDWIFWAGAAMLPLCNATKVCVLFDKRRPGQQAPVTDLLATLTAHGLRGPHRDTALRPPGGRRAPALDENGVEMKPIARFFDWLNAAIAEGERMRQEAYLAQASDHFDLECRMRELEREPSRMRNWW